MASPVRFASGSTEITTPDGCGFPQMPPPVSFDSGLTAINIPQDVKGRRARLFEQIRAYKGDPRVVQVGDRFVKLPEARPTVLVAPAESYMARRWKEPPRCRGEASFPEKSFLLDKIRKYHLQALALMGKDAARHARGMVFAGYTYGLLPDPVANIVANALWYDATFPSTSSSSESEEPAGAPSVKMLSAKALFRMACRSLDALVAFMTHFAPTLSTQEILSCLASVDGNLQDAVSVLRGRSDLQLCDQQAGFRAAVEASDLPSYAARDAHLQFVSSIEPALHFLGRTGN